MKQTAFQSRAGACSNRQLPARLRSNVPNGCCAAVARLISHFLVVLSVLLSARVLAADGQLPAGSDDCQILFAEGDPRLYEFIETRRTVNFKDYEGRRIGSIQYVALPIFNPDDPDEDNALYRAVNWLHILTKTSPLKRQVLVHENDPLDVEQVRESERILRGAGYLYDAMILPARVCADSVDLLVVVRDVWTLQPTVSFSRTGGENSKGFGISDKNILGYGHAVSLMYKADDERKGVGISFSSDHVWDGHTALDLEHVDNNDGSSDRIALSRPFYAIDTPWSAGALYETYDIEQEITTADVTSNEYDQHSENMEVFGGALLRLQDNLVWRGSVGITRERDNYDNQREGYTDPLPQDQIIAYPWIEFDSVEYRYWTTSNLYQLFRNEDINLGTQYAIRIGATSSALGSTENRWITRLNWQRTSSFGKNHAMRNSVYLNLARNRDTGEQEDSTWGYTAIYDHFIDDLNRWHVQFQYQGGNGLEVGDMFTIGGGEVLRGYEKDTQRGDRYAVLNIEHRHFFDVHPFNLFRIGSAVFFEAGRAWESRPTLEQSDAVLYDIGVGLRINSSKARPDHIFHINLAAPLTERDISDKYLISFFASTTI